MQLSSESHGITANDDHVSYCDCCCNIARDIRHYPNKQAEVTAPLENMINGTTIPNDSQMAGIANL